MSIQPPFKNRNIRIRYGRVWTVCGAAYGNTFPKTIVKSQQASIGLTGQRLARICGFTIASRACARRHGGMLENRGYQ
jgi:hypothetical protein